MVFMFRELLARIQRRTIRLQTDPALQNQILPIYRNNSGIEFHFSLFDLVVAIATSRSVAPTESSKFSQATDFLKIFAGNNQELRISLENLHLEQKQHMSKHLGEGLSLIVAEKLFDLKKSTISRIRRRRNQSKPDFMGFTKSHLKIVWEAKGSTDPFKPREIAHAINQKSNERANSAFASLAKLNTETMIKVNLYDPTTLPLSGDILDYHLSRIKHYVNLFNFIGQKELSRYFKLLGKRLEKDREFPEFQEKVELFNRIKEKSIKLRIYDEFYLGNIERVGEARYFYVGFDERLLSVQGFFDFEDYEEKLEFKQSRNFFKITKDGICYGVLHDLEDLRNLGMTKEIVIPEIPYYKDKISIRDLDYMLHSQIVEYVKYLFKRERFKIRTEKYEKNKRYDLLVSKERKKYIVEIKKKVPESFEQLRSYMDEKAVIFITIRKVPEKMILFAQNYNIFIIDRTSLNDIIKKHKTITQLLKE